MHKKIIFSKLLILVISLFVTKAYAGDHYSFEARARSAPTIGNVQASANYDQMLWGEKTPDNPLYGYLRAGARGGGSPTYAGFLQVAPIAPIIFEVQKGVTHRFLKISGFACSEIECKGKVDRTDYSIKLLAAFKDFVFLGNIMWREIQTGSSPTLVGLEYEFFEVTPGFHRFFETTWTLGYKLSSGNMIGLVNTQGEMSEGNRRSSSVHAIYRFPYQDFSLVTGIGNFKSDQNNLNQTSVIFSATYQWGERLSLY